VAAQRVGALRRAHTPREKVGRSESNAINLLDTFTGSEVVSVHAVDVRGGNRRPSGQRKEPLAGGSLSPSRAIRPQIQIGKPTLPEHGAIASQAGDGDRERLLQASKTGEGRAPVRSGELEPGDGGTAAVPADDLPGEGVGLDRPGDSQLITRRANNPKGIPARACRTAPGGAGSAPMPVTAGCWLTGHADASDPSHDPSPPRTCSQAQAAECRLRQQKKRTPRPVRLEGCQNSIRRRNRVFGCWLPKFGSCYKPPHSRCRSRVLPPHTSLPMFAPRPWGDAGCAHRFSAVAAGALRFFLFVCHTWPECI
jgi:hypothetical protein